MPTYKHILICGGAGKRLWPLSREIFPKPYLSLNNTMPLFQQALLRHPDCVSHTVITNEALYYQSEYQAKHAKVSEKTHYLLEAVGRNTGPAILMAALDAEDDDILVVTPADHAISPTDAYLNDIHKACRLVDAHNSIVLIGITPTYPATEYGYIEAAGETVKSFKEKPSAELAAQYLETGNYLWNSGIFCFKAGVIKACFKSIAPATYNAIKQAYEQKKQPLNILDLSPVKDMSFDRGILEHTKNIQVIPNTFSWSDLGSFDALEDFYTPHIEVNAKNNFAISTTQKTIAIHDVDDVYVIESNDAILVGKKGASHKVSELVKKVGKLKPSLLQHSKRVYRPWGYYEVLQESETYKVKKIIVYPKCRLSLQKHKHRSEHWTCVLGALDAVVNDTVTALTPNKSIYIPKGSVHRMDNKSEELAEIIEVQCGSYLGEDDIVRLQADY